MASRNLLFGTDMAADDGDQGGEVLLSLVRSRGGRGDSTATTFGNKNQRGSQVGLGAQQPLPEALSEPYGSGTPTFAVSHGGTEYGEVDQEAILAGKGDGRDGPSHVASWKDQTQSFGEFAGGPLQGLPIFSRHRFFEEDGAVGKGSKKGKGAALPFVPKFPHGDLSGHAGGERLAGLREGEAGMKRKGMGEEATASFPPSPKGSSRRGLFSGWSTPESPLKSLIRPAMRLFRSAREGKGPPIVAQKEKVQPPAAIKEKGRKRTGFQAALAVAKEVKSSKKQMQDFDNQFSSESSRAPKDSRRKLVMGVLETYEGKGKTFPLTAEAFKFLGTVLWKANYKSAELYLTEAKLMHVEMGYDWTAQLDLMLKRCKRGAARDRGPRLKAPEVNKERRMKAKRTTLPRSPKVLHAKELFAFAMVWMLREAELSKISREDITLKEDKKYVALKWSKSKMDQKGFGTSRVLACLCEGVRCEEECPFRITKDLLQKVGKSNPSSSALCLVKGNNKVKAKKSQIVKAWSLAFAMKVTGHSARRTGALNYIRSGWTIPQVAYLGRWSSSIIYSYAQEALESLPVNSKSQPFGTPCQVAFDENGRIAESKSFVESLELELAEFKRDSKNTAKVLKKEIEDLSKNFGTARDGPPRVQGLQSGLVHENNTPITSVPPAYWRTKCGWSFKYGNFCFVPAEKAVTCSKCLGGIQPALSQGGSLGRL